MKSTEPLYLGVDIGGTKVAAGLVASRGEIAVEGASANASDEDAAAGLLVVEKAIDAAFKPNLLASLDFRNRNREPGPSIPGWASS